MYFDFIRNELDRISREQEEKFESKECICSLSLRDLFVEHFGMRNLTVFNNSVVDNEKCARFFIDNCGQGFTAPCCYHVNEYGKINTREYDTFVECNGDKSNCIMYIYNLNKTDIL